MVLLTLLVPCCRYMQKVKRVTPDNNASQLLEQHPKYTWALALLTNKVPECIKDKVRHSNYHGRELPQVSFWLQQNTSFAATKVFLSYLSRQNFCCDKLTFVVTNTSLL